MLLPLVAVLVFLLNNPSVWTSDLAVFFSQDREAARRDPGWILSALALGAAAFCAWLGVLGTQESWKYNRRAQRGLLGSLAAALLSVLFSGWAMTQEITHGGEPAVGLAMFATMCALLYGVVCAVLSPRDHVNPPHPEETEWDDGVNASAVG